MKLPDRIRRIHYHTAMGLVRQYHYLHRAAPCSCAFGLFNGTRLVGCITYGTPSSAPLRGGICGPDESNNVIELTRLWIRDGEPKNSASFLIGNTIPPLRKRNRCFIRGHKRGSRRHGLSGNKLDLHRTLRERTNWTIEGVDKHCQTIADRFTAQDIRDTYGDKFSLVERPRKHRYIFFNCDKRRKRELLKKLRYPILPYPKAESFTLLQEATQ